MDGEGLNDEDYVCVSLSNKERKKEKEMTHICKKKKKKISINITILGVKENTTYLVVINMPKYKDLLKRRKNPIYTVIGNSS